MQAGFICLFLALFFTYELFICSLCEPSELLSWSGAVPFLIVHSLLCIYLKIGQQMPIEQYDTFQHSYTFVANVINFNCCHKILQF